MCEGRRESLPQQRLVRARVSDLDDSTMKRLVSVVWRTMEFSRV